MPGNRTRPMVKPNSTYQPSSRYTLLTRKAVFIDHNTLLRWAPFNIKENSETLARLTNIKLAILYLCDTMWPKDVRVAGSGQKM